MFNITNTEKDLYQGVKLSFYLGAFFSLLLFMPSSNKEYPPSDAGFKEKVKESNSGLAILFINFSCFDAYAKRCE